MSSMLTRKSDSTVFTCSNSVLGGPVRSGQAGVPRLCAWGAAWQGCVILHTPCLCFCSTCSSACAACGCLNLGLFSCAWTKLQLPVSSAISAHLICGIGFMGLSTMCTLNFTWAGKTLVSTNQDSAGLRKGTAVEQAMQLTSLHLASTAHSACPCQAVVANCWLRFSDIHAWGRSILDTFLAASVFLLEASP